MRREFSLSRSINDERVWLGLSLNDVLNLIVLYPICETSFSGLTFKGIGFVLTILAGAILIPIRMKYRQKIVRDSLGFLNRKIFG